MPGKRKFIDKKNSVTYRLVPRCQLDPEGDASEHVLVPVNEAAHEKSKIKLPESALPPPAKDISSLKKHLPVKGPQPDWDPDIVATLDDSFNEDAANDLEDDFVAMAKGSLAESQHDEESECSSEDYDSDGGFLFSDDESGSFDEVDEGKSRLSKYSLTSAVTNCTEEVKLLNERFEKFCEIHYTEDQIGPLDGEVIEGYLSADSKIVDELAGDIKNYKKRFYLDDYPLEKDLRNKVVHYAETGGKEKPVEIVIEQPLEFDCESILSTYSNKYNHPTTIKEEKKIKPQKISIAQPLQQKLTKRNLKQLNREANPKDDEESVVSDDDTIVSSCNIRPKGETPEERRLRKHALKQIRRENRIIKKEDKLAFNQEKRKQMSAELNARRNKTISLV